MIIQDKMSKLKEWNVFDGSIAPRRVFMWRVQNHKHSIVNRYCGKIFSILICFYPRVMWMHSSAVPLLFFISPKYLYLLAFFRVALFKFDLVL